MNIAIVIPARYQSSRLPGKPLVDICGLPMIIRTYQQCIKAVSAESVHVATDDERIANVCREHGAQVLMTSPDCLTGTDRVAEAARMLSADCFINVQGDEPLFNPEDLSALIASAQRYPGDIINGFCRVSSEEQYRSGSIPKVVMRQDGRLLYMSRAPVPTNKNLAFVSGYRQVCAYAFPKDALQAFASVREKTPLERIEDIEILRFLELGWEIRMIPMSDVSIAVDNPGDLLMVERRIQETEHAHQP